jgi:hypothetical protein
MNRLELLAALKAVTPGLATGSSMVQGADTVVLSPGLVQTYNDHVSVTHPAPVPEEITAAIKAAEMVKVLEKMAGLDITAKITDKNKLELSDGRTTLSMTLVEANTTDMIRSLDLEGLEWLPLPKGFAKALALTAPGASRNPAHGVWAGVCILIDRLLSTDNFRASWADLEEHMVRPGTPFAPFVLPAPAALRIAAMDGLESWAATPSWAHFMDKNGAVFSSRLLGGEFPVDGVLNLFPEAVGETWELPEALKPALERAAVMASPLDSGMDFVTIRRDGQDIVVMGEQSAGSVTDRVPAGERGWPEGAAIRISPKYLLDIMGATRTFRMTGTMLAFEAPGFRHVTSTISLEG